jgi:hypothetical protein
MAAKKRNAMTAGDRQGPYMRQIVRSEPTGRGLWKLRLACGHVDMVSVDPLRLQGMTYCPTCVYDGKI